MPDLVVTDTEDLRSPFSVKAHDGKHLYTAIAPDLPDSPKQAAIRNNLRDAMRFAREYVAEHDCEPVSVFSSNGIKVTDVEANPMVKRLRAQVVEAK